MKHKWIDHRKEDWDKYNKYFICTTCGCTRYKDPFGYTYSRSGHISSCAESFPCLDIEKENLKTID